MTSERDLGEALQAQSSQVELPAGDLLAVLDRGRQRRRRRQTLLVSGALVLVLLAGGVGLASIQRGADGVIVDAAAPSPAFEEPAAAPDAEDTDPGADAADQSSPNGDTDRVQRTFDRIEAEDGCGWSDDPRPDALTASSIISIHTMPDETAIALVTCAMGAYQATDVRLFELSEEDQGLAISPLIVESFGDAGVEQTTRLSGHIEIDDQAGVMTVYTRYRSTGDCGTSLVLRWAGGEVGRFELDTAHGVLDCPTDSDAGSEGLEWPPLYPSTDEPADAESQDPQISTPGLPPTADEEPAESVALAVSEPCNSIDRRAVDIFADGAAMDCLQDALVIEFDSINQFWIEDVIDDGDRTLVVWRGSAFDGDFGAGTPWGFEEIHVTDTTGWTDQLVRRLDWEDPSDVDWMYAYRIELVEASTLRILQGWHQGACYWVDHLDLDGVHVPINANLYPQPASLVDLAANPDLCRFTLDDEPAILADMFSAPEPIRSFGR